MDYRYELVGVLGHPVAENPTCVMQEAAFAALELRWRYLTIDVTPQSLPDAMRGVRALGMKGINLTIPHKVAILPLLDEVSTDAALAGVAGLTLINRSEERGRRLCDDLNQRIRVQTDFLSWQDTYCVGPDVDILVNATSIGLYPEVEAMPAVNLQGAGGDLLVCDVVPNPPETRLIRTARALGFKTLTGLPMLVYQGAIGFKMWTGQDAPEAAMKEALEHAFQCA